MRRFILFLLFFYFSFAGNFGFTLSGGFLYGNYTQFNYLVDYENSWLKFYNEDWGNFLKQQGFLKDFGYSSGELNRLNSSLPLKLRFYYKNGKSTFSIEGTYLTASAVSNTEFFYDFTFMDGTSATQKFSFYPFELKPEMFSAGIGLSRQLLKYKKFCPQLEASAGFIYLNFLYENNLQVLNTIGSHWLKLSYETIMEGKGKGFYGYGGLKIPVLQRGRFSLSLTPGYFYSKILSIRGSTTYKYSISDSYGYTTSYSDSWDGEWFIKEITVKEWWGTYTFRFPSNNKSDLGSYIKNAGRFSPSISGPFLLISVGIDL
ncbi:MAG: hypothetical protein J7L62_07190 [Candidatus Aminicenantes bacterium]|nr:hypothetical protein [Candidatus Aminicenantes bacterium]